MYNHNKAQQSKNRVHISWAILYVSSQNPYQDICSKCSIAVCQINLKKAVTELALLRISQFFFNSTYVSAYDYCYMLLLFYALSNMIEQDLQCIIFGIQGHHRLQLKPTPLEWRHNGLDSVSNHQPYDCLLNRLFRRRSKKASKLRVTGLCEGNSPGAGEFPAQMVSNTENASIWWRHHA